MQYFKNKPLVFLLFLFLFLSFFLCCKKNHLQQMEREDLFSLSYGSFENQINLFELESSYTRPDSQISMKDGIFYISNSASGKIMQMTSFGDLLSIIYNVDKNPQPIFTNSENSQTKATTRKSVQYPLNHPTFLAITDNKQLYVVDSVFFGSG
ncbi:LIC_12708 family protein [Treponema phagedenis]|uniref:LIC_12708 family protein n=1 Tax=Treponema phagedenis TaxID=162 RepID=UPI003EB97E4D